jgi:hypothetical protein
MPPRRKPPIQSIRFCVAVDKGGDFTYTHVEIMNLDIFVSEFVKELLKALLVQEGQASLMDLKLYDATGERMFSGSGRNHQLSARISRSSMKCFDGARTLSSYFSKEPEEMEEKKNGGKKVHILAIFKSDGSKIDDGGLGFLHKFKKTAPSSAARPSLAIKQQNNPETNFYYNRPPPAGYYMPVALLEPIFNEFIDDCTNLSPTQPDHDFATGLAAASAEFYKNEENRRQALLQVFDNHGLRIKASQIGPGSAKTDADYDVGEGDSKSKALIVEIKNDTTNGDPVMQVSHYYNRSFSAREEVVAAKKSIFPCLGMYLQGTATVCTLSSSNLATIGAAASFFGMVWTDRPHIQPLGILLRMDEHPGDIEHHENLARALGACKKAVAKLEIYYEQGLPDASPPLPRIETLEGLLFPRYTTYKLLTSEGEPVKPEREMTLTYRAPYTEGSGSQNKNCFRSKLVFEARDNDNNHLCIKFVKRYGKEAHIQFAEHTLAPRLLGFREIGGGWKMVVMDYLSNPYFRGGDLCDKKISSNTVRKAIKEQLQVMHRLGYVHGDVRNPNLMIKLDDDEKSLVDLKLVDFDWAGKEGEVRYPHNLNTRVKRADDALSSRKIRAEHDIFMIDELFKSESETSMDIDMV